MKYVDACCFARPMDRLILAEVLHLLQDRSREHWTILMNKRETQVNGWQRAITSLLGLDWSDNNNNKNRTSTSKTIQIWIWVIILSWKANWKRIFLNPTITVKTEEENLLHRFFNRISTIPTWTRISFSRIFRCRTLWTFCGFGWQRWYILNI